MLPQRPGQCFLSLRVEYASMLGKTRLISKPSTAAKETTQLLGVMPGAFSYCRRCSERHSDLNKINFEFPGLLATRKLWQRVVSRHSSSSNQTTYHTHFIQLMEASANTTRTRSKNKGQHPGAIEIAAKRKRWTKAQIEADNAEEEAKKDEKGRKTRQQIKKIASLESKMAEKDAEADSAHPRSRNGDVHIVVTCPCVYDISKTDVHMESDDNAMDVQPKPKQKPRPTKNSQRQANIPNVADQRDLTADKGRIRTSLFFIYRCGCNLASFRKKRRANTSR